MPRKRKPEEIKNPATKITADNIGAHVDWADYKVSTIANLAPASRTSAHYRRDFQNVLPNISGRPNFTREDYDYFRPEEAIPTKFPEVMYKCNGVYRNVGLIRNIIDLMGDFTVQGISVVHPNKRIEKFFQNWWTLVGGTSFSERISNTLYRLSNVPIQVYTTKITPTELDKMYQTVGSPDRKGIPIKYPPLENRELPYKYVILNPATVVPVGGALSSFVNEPLYGLVLSAQVRQTIIAPKTEEEKAIVARLPEDIKLAAMNNKPYILDPAKTVMLCYKKDDWKTFADPMIYAILDDIEILEKLKLADMAALDAATGKIRIFRLGDIEHKIAPSPALADKLSEILQNNVGGGVTDIVWGPDIDIIETAIDSYNFLGDAKYQGTLNNIYAGMGIPPTLTGTFGAAGTTNNFISLKTLTERLEYGRSILTSFWDTQLKQVQKAMGFRFPAQIVFDKMILGDEAAEKALLIQLADRNLISDEMIQHIFKHDPELERIRMKRENQERDTGKRVPKSGAWHDPQPGNKLKQIALQSGQASPSEVGLELEERKAGEVNMMEHQLTLEKEKVKNKPKPAVSPKRKPKGRSGTGRPKNSKDSTKRKAKTFRARSIIESWTRVAQAQISDVINEAVLSIHKKKNLRQLSTEQVSASELVKFSVLCSMMPYAKIDKGTVFSVINNSLGNEAQNLYNILTSDFVRSMERQPTLEEIRNIQVNVYLALLDKDEDNGQS